MKNNKELIQKWKDKHHLLLSQYNGSVEINMPGSYLSTLRSRMVDILDFIDDLEKQK